MSCDDADNTANRQLSNADTAKLKLRPATDADWPELKRWLRLPGVGDWLGSPNAAEAEIRIVFATESAVARIIEWNGQAIGYAHAIDATHWGSALPDGMPTGTWDLDCLIAEPRHRGTGFGQIAVNRLVDEVFATTFAIAVSVIVPVRNERAVRAYERAGFHWVRVLDDPLFGPSWLLLRERTPQRAH